MARVHGKRLHGESFDEKARNTRLPPLAAEHGKRWRTSTSSWQNRAAVWPPSIKGSNSSGCV
jgi:hypothetical protein